MSKLYFLSFGIQTPLGLSLLSSVLSPQEVQDKKIVLIAGEHDWLSAYLKNSCLSLGFSKENIFVIDEKNPSNFDNSYDYIYVAEGNTFRMLQFIRERNLVTKIKNQVQNGANYIGVSAGAHIAGSDITTALPFDSNSVHMTDFTGLALFNGVVIPHYEAMDKQRFLVYKQARENPQYQNVYTVRNDEVIVINYFTT